MRPSVCCVALLLIATLSDAGATGRRPWQWTVEERLAVRFDPEHIKARRLAQLADDPRAATDGSATGTAGRRVTIYGIDGARNPELFLPHELFDGLLTGFTPDLELRARQRQSFARAIRAFGYDDAEFWRRLEVVSAEYVALKYGDGRADWTARCRARHAALQAARNTFGGFDVFLYTVIAPSARKVVTSDVDDAARLRDETAGCAR